jgi:hypothetical protein
MPGLPQVLAGLAIAAVVVTAAVYVSSRSHNRRAARPEGPAAVSPERFPPASGGMAVPAVTVQPSSVMTGPFAYDNGVLTGPPPGGERP